MPRRRLWRRLPQLTARAIRIHIGRTEYRAVKAFTPLVRGCSLRYWSDTYIIMGVRTWRACNAEPVFLRLERKVALVTGAGRNIAKRCDRRLARAGARVVVNGVAM